MAASLAATSGKGYSVKPLHEIIGEVFEVKCCNI